MRSTELIGRLPSEFRERADELQRFAPAAAEAYRDAATRVERAMADEAGEPLKLPEAARVSGYTADHLSRLIAAGKLRNVGRKHAPLVLRGDLPVKPRAELPPLQVASGGAAVPDTMPSPDMLSRARAARRSR